MNTYIIVPIASTTKRKCLSTFCTRAYSNVGFATQEARTYTELFASSNYNQRQKWLELEGRLDLTEFDKLFNELNEVK